MTTHRTDNNLYREKYIQLQGEFAEWKRIWEIEDVKARLDTYTEGYRQRAEALMDEQAKALKYNMLKRDYEGLQNSYEQLNRVYEVSLQRSQAAETRLFSVIQALFPDVFYESVSDDAPF